MSKAAGIAILLATLFVAASAGARAQSPAKEEAERCSVSGTVTVKGKPARRVKVVALSADRHTKKPVAIAITDEGGRYQLKGFPAGSYAIKTEAPAFTSNEKERPRSLSEKSLILAEGESVEGIDFDLKPGGVITGRVTDANGRPLIDEDVEITPFTGDRYNDLLSTISWTMDNLSLSTDDRGVYRAYGLPPGRYRVSVGDASWSTSRPSFGQSTVPLTYHPGVTIESKAEAVEVTEGGEAVDVDIKVSRPSRDRSKLFTVTGRVVDGETGKPLPGVAFTLRGQEDDDSEDEDEDSDSAEDISEYEHTDPRGGFRVESLPPGRYEIEVSAEEDSPWYGKKALFEISDADVEGLEVKAYPAGSITGVVVLEGARDPAAIARLSRLIIGNGQSFYPGTPVKSDGSFHIKSVGPGPYNLSINTRARGEGFELLRIELGGVEQKTGEIDVAPGQQVTGVRVVVVYHKGVIRGQIKIEGGTLPRGSHLSVSAAPTNKPQESDTGPGREFAFLLGRARGGVVDARGHFAIERLPPGEYEVKVTLFTNRIPRPRGRDEVDNEAFVPPMSVSKIVTVTEEGEAFVSFALDLSKRPEGKRR